MCQIQFFKRLNGNLTKEDINNFCLLMELGNISNNCAYGFFNENVFFKDTGDFKLKRVIQKHNLSNSNFLVGHNRFATKGSKEENKNNHPFILNDFTLVHNGVIDNDDDLRNKYNIKTDIETDSYSILWLIDYFFKKSKKNNRTDKIKDAIKKTTKKLKGYYSVFLFDKKTENLFYFKDELADFSFLLLDDNFLIGTTDKDNIKDIFKANKLIFKVNKFKKLDVQKAKHNTIYLINDKVKIKEIGKFKSNERTTYEFYPSQYETISYGDYKEIKDYNASYGVDDGEDEFILKEPFIRDLLFEILNYDYEFEYNIDYGDIIFDYDIKLYRDLKTIFDNVYKSKGKIYLNVGELYNYC